MTICEVGCVLPKGSFFFGGNSNNGANSGPFYVNSNNAFSNSNANIGSRLTIIQKRGKTDRDPATIINYAEMSEHISYAERSLTKKSLAFRATSEISKQLKISGVKKLQAKYI